MEKITAFLVAVGVIFSAYVTFIKLSHQRKKDINLSKSEAIKALDETNNAISSLEYQIHYNSEWIERASGYVLYGKEIPFDIQESLQAEDFSLPEIITISNPNDTLPTHIQDQMMGVRQHKIDSNLREKSYLHENGVDEELFIGMNNTLREHSKK